MAKKLKHHINKSGVKAQILLSIALTVALLLPYTLFVLQEHQMYIDSDSYGIISFFQFRYQTKYALITDIVVLLILSFTIVTTIKIYHYLKSNHIFSELTQSAEIPLFILDDNHQLYWTNAEQVSYLTNINHNRALTLFLADDAAVGKLNECFATGESQHIEKSFKVGGKTYWFHITLAKLKSKNLVSGFLSDITELKSATNKIDNQQREMQMQNEMLSIITAQLEVQQAAMKEQNDVLTEQHKKLELQARMLKTNNEELELRNKLITKKNIYITDSIRYAQTIQEALLPSEKQMKNFFENFVIYRPKDIVSGDFYWFAVTEQ
ncbi:MAG: hypothetical protein J6T70_01705, partial [Bacteroidales bacterium]|nr:hypothetical protein [Bacteroidales bacterium]